MREFSGRENHTIEEIEAMFKRCDWKSFYNLVHSIGPGLNHPSWRMMKGEVINLALEKSCDENLKYVDRPGCDLIYISDDKLTRIEVKSDMNMFYKDRHGKKIARATLKNKIQLKNTMGRLGQLYKTFDYLLLIQTRGQAIISLTPFDKVQKNSIKTADQIKVEQLKEDEMIFISPKAGFENMSTVSFSKPLDSNVSSRMKDGMELRYRIIEIIKEFLEEKMK